MKWLVDDLKALSAQLKRGSTWVAIGLILAFGLFGLTIARFAFQTDSLLRFLHIANFSCRELTNGAIIFLFSGMIFFTLTVVATLGEVRSYFYHRDHRSLYAARQSLIYSLVWGGTATGIFAAALTFFKLNC